MKNKQILFFATLTDITPIIRVIEKSYPMKYYKMGLFDSKSSEYFNSVLEIPNFGTPLSGDWNKDLRVMAIPENLSLTIREVPQKKGDMKYAIDPLLNQTSICFQFGGIYREGILVAGNCFTTTSSEFALQVFKDFSTHMKRDFRRIDRFFIGKEAEQKLKEGWRLVQDEGISKEYDLTLNG